MKNSYVTLLLCFVGFGEVQAQTETGYWGCLWVDALPSPQNFLFWCYVNDESDQKIPCVSVADGESLDTAPLVSFIQVEPSDVSRFFQPREGICPILPGNMPNSSDIIRGD